MPFFCNAIAENAEEEKESTRTCFCSISTGSAYSMLEGSERAKGKVKWRNKQGYRPVDETLRVDRCSTKMEWRRIHLLMVLYTVFLVRRWKRMGM